MLERPLGFPYLTPIKRHPFRRSKMASSSILPVYSLLPRGSKYFYSVSSQRLISFSPCLVSFHIFFYPFASQRCLHGGLNYLTHLEISFTFFFHFFHPQFPLYRFMYSCVHIPSPSNFWQPKCEMHRQAGVGGKQRKRSHRHFFLYLKKYFPSIVFSKWCCMSEGCQTLGWQKERGYFNTKLLQWWNMNRWCLVSECKYCHILALFEKPI